MKKPFCELKTYSTFDNKFSGLALRTTNINRGTKVSALSSEFRCRIRPVDIFRRYTRYLACNKKEQTENNFAAIQDADQLVPRGFIVINFYQFYENVR